MLKLNIFLTEFFEKTSELVNNLRPNFGYVFLDLSNVKVLFLRLLFELCQKG